MPYVTSRDGTRIAFDKLGRGPPLIYVYGATCFRDLPPVRATADALAAQFTVFHYDRRGRGDSGDTPPFAVARELEDLDALLTVAGGSAILFGHSSGGALALEAALALGGRVAALAIYEAPYAASEEDAAAARQFDAQLAELLAAGKRGDAVAFFWSGLEMPAAMLDEARESAAWPTFEALAHTLRYDAAVVGGTAPVARAAAISVPTLVMYSDDSYAFMRDVATQLAGAIPRAELAALPGGHAGDPVAITNAIAALWRRTR